MKKTIFGTIAGAAVIACVAGLASPALAAETTAPSSTAPAPASSTPPKHSGTPRTLATVQAAGKAATATRIATLNVTIPKITANKYLTPSDRSTILATLNHDLSSMDALQTKIAADTDLKTAAADVQSIYTGYRVFAVAIPQSHYAAAADGLTVPGMMDEPGWISGTRISSSPVYGPLDSSRISFAMRISSRARVRNHADASPSG